MLQERDLTFDEFINYLVFYCRHQDHPGNSALGCFTDILDTARCQGAHGYFISTTEEEEEEEIEHYLCMSWSNGVRRLHFIPASNIPVEGSDFMRSYYIPYDQADQNRTIFNRVRAIIARNSNRRRPGGA